mgnify:CR=1 FL=1
MGPFGPPRLSRVGQVAGHLPHVRQFLGVADGFQRVGRRFEPCRWADIYPTPDSVGGGAPFSASKLDGSLRVPRQTRWRGILSGGTGGAATAALQHCIIGGLSKGSDAGSDVV